jgi:serine/threonine-protein phosphatase PP1 catalytic subunit
MDLCLPPCFPEAVRLVVVRGATHSHFFNFLRLLEPWGESRFVACLLLRDSVDGDIGQMNSIALPLLSKLTSSQPCLLRCGHLEAAQQNLLPGFGAQCKSRSAKGIFERFSSLFHSMPIRAVIDPRIYCVSSRIGPEMHDLDELREIRRSPERASWPACLAASLSAAVIRFACSWGLG